MGALPPLGERHRIVARTTDGRYVTDRALIGLTWRQAQAMWTDLDNARRAGRLPLVDYIVVRSEADPDPRWCLAAGQWNGPTSPPSYGQASYDFLPFVVGRQRGHAELRGAAKAWGASRGYRGYVGGWIYNTADIEREKNGGRPARAYCQGWDTLVYGRSPQPVGRHERRYYWNDLHTLYEAATAAA